MPSIMLTIGPTMVDKIDYMVQSLLSIKYSHLSLCILATVCPSLSANSPVHEVWHNFLQIDCCKERYVVSPWDLHAAPQDLNLEYALTLPQCSTHCTLKHKCSDMGY